MPMVVCLRSSIPILAFVLIVHPAAWCDDATPRYSFRKHTIDDAFPNGYQVSTADIDRDGDLDVIALSTTPSQLVWYQNPTWARLDLNPAIQRPIDCAPFDIDGDGDSDLAVASDFNLGDSEHGGTLQWLECPPDPASGAAWAIHPIDAIPTSHRIRWVRWNGDARPTLLNLPIIGMGAVPPEYAAGVSFRAYALTASPAAGPWGYSELDKTLHMAHGICVAAWDVGGPPSVFTASFEGVHRYSLRGEDLVKQPIGVGHDEARPKRGSSEVGLGRLSPGQRFVATIEPWHGTEVVIYVGRDEDSLPWPRTVIDTGLEDGHALVCMDVDGDGADEIIASGRGGAHDVRLYAWMNGAWQRHLLDRGGMAAAGFSVADIDGDGKPDLVATGTATHNVVWYGRREETSGAEAPPGFNNFKKSALLTESEERAIIKPR
jgi:hypothetical protein